MSLGPAFAALSGLALLGERLSGRLAASIGLVVVASVGISRTSAPPPEA
jgi:threonine/homoserine efflux transporter RhtA